ncbi:hypothetical protein GCM10010495_48940 [Kitasatospora herbaricolor]|uniref:hypothetical protein n=1 Tax=Kitasatospora herbaricolor TaxID=68217 RepID=UPI001749B6E5|nr:hypothetical protein [Kitasatospora herbaricolor]MDQ0305738.1 hypothetical protein [Kitasatospora herbaricolor]GGV27085.1 hypothetical protein GCM10010495_48940 [Kitasatospora herbaricolor]
MTAPPPPSEPVQYALTSVYTDPFLGGTDGPSLLTADPTAAAHFFLDTDRLGHLEVMAHATDHDATLVPIRAGDIVHRALAELPAGDARRDTLRTAQADWLEDRLWDRADEPFGAAPGGPDWIRAGSAWGAAFTALPGADVLAELASHYPGVQVPQVPLVMAALRTARAIRQAAGPVVEEDRQLLVANWRMLNSSWPAREEPAVLAAAHWYLERLADLDPLTAQPAADLTDTQRARWREDAVDLQRDLLVLDPHLHPARIEAVTAHVRTEPADRTPDKAARAEETDHRRLDTALAVTLRHLPPLDEEVRERMRSAAAGVLQPPQPLPLPGQPASDADAALDWRRQVPSAQRAAADTDAVLTQAYTHVARARREAGEGRRSLADQSSTAPAHTLAAETTGRHAVMGRLLALADAERAATAHEPHLHDVAGAAAQTARAAAQALGLSPMEAHYAEQAAYTATFDAGRALLDEVLTEQRAAVRATIAAHYPRPDHRLTDQLAAGIDNKAAARAQNAVAVLGRELDNLLAQDRDPATRLRPTAEQIKEARSRSDAAGRRLNDIVNKDRPATRAALRALREVMDLPAAPPPGDGADRLTRHLHRLTERLTGALPAAATTGPAAATTTPRPRPARHQPRPTTVKRGMR